MRSRFPIAWLLQAIVLLVWSCVCLLFPQELVERYTGLRAPREAIRPSAALHRWTLAIEQIPVPNDLVRSFFREHEEELFPDEKIWTPRDPSIRREEWTAAWKWVAGFQPALPPAQAAAISTWLRAVDEAPEPSTKLRRWVSSLAEVAPPEPELLAWILEARQVSPVRWTLAADQVRARAPFMLALALFTILGMLSPGIRRPLARVFVLAFLFLCLAEVRGLLGPPRWKGSYILLGIGLLSSLTLAGACLRTSPRQAFAWALWILLIGWSCFVTVRVIQSRFPPFAELAFASGLLLVVLNGYYWLIGKDEDPSQDDAGIAQGRPPQLWTIWAIQFILLFTVGLASVLFADEMLALLTDADHDRLGTVIVDNQMRLLGASIAGTAMLSYFALGATRDWIWRGIALIFGVVFVFSAGQTVFSAASGEYSLFGLLFGFQGLVFVPLTVWIMRREDPWFADNVERDQAEWSVTDLLVGLPMMAAPLIHRRRKLFATGVAARGRLRIQFPAEDGEDRLPANEFFAPGHELAAVVRFSNCTQDDDAALDIRGCALHLVDAEQGGELDLLMATGSFSPARDLRSFRKLVFGRRSLRRAIRDEQIIREGLAASMRRAPDSFASLAYYHQPVRHWFSPDARRWLARFRLVPESIANTRPLDASDREDLEEPWPHERRAGEERPRDYLRQELAQRLSRSEPTRFTLEVQLHDPVPGEPDDWYDASAEWPPSDHPWCALGRLELTSVLSREEEATLCFDPLEHPRSVAIPKANGPSDPRWIGAAQPRVVQVLAALRLRRHARARAPSGGAR